VRYKLRRPAIQPTQDKPTVLVGQGRFPVRRIVISRLDHYAWRRFSIHIQKRTRDFSTTK